MPPISDKKILDLYQQPAKRSYAFKLLVEKYQVRVYWIIRRMILNHDDTNDVMQESFIKIWKNLPDFREESSLYSWIYRVTINEVYNFFRMKKRVHTIQTTALTDEMIQVMTEDPWFDGDKAQVKLQKAILQLPEKQQIVFNLRYFEEIKYEEMSKILDTSQGSLKASYHWAVKKIEEYLKSH
ncbi:MAG: RNA polymerase sigma factor [Bacteroidales bacterium]